MAAEWLDRKFELVLYKEDFENGIEPLYNWLQKNENVKYFASILHDRDLDEFGEIKKAHWHTFVALDKPTSITAFRNKMVQGLNETLFPKGIEMRFFEHVKNFKRAMLYLCHRADKTKYQYPFEEIVFSDIDFKNKVETIYSSYQDTGVSAYELKKSILNDVMNGTIRQFQFEDKIPRDLYVEKNFNFQLRKAIEYFHNSVFVGGKTMRTIWISGPAGCGKTSFAKLMADNANLVYNVFGASKNPIESYRDEPCLILDDFRIEDIKQYKDLLSLTDPHNHSFQSARYTNKRICAELVCIPTIKSPIDVANDFCKLDEPKEQLYRRIETWVEFENVQCSYDTQRRVWFKTWDVQEGWVIMDSQLFSAKSIVEQCKDYQAKNIEEKKKLFAGIINQINGQTSLF